MSYEIHLTFDRKHAPTVKAYGDHMGWKFSQIEGDPVLGQDVYCYLTMHKKSALAAFESMKNMFRVLQHHTPVEPLRQKIELIIYDTKTGTGVE